MELKRTPGRRRKRRQDRESNAAFHQLYKRLQNEDALRNVRQCNTIEVGEQEGEHDGTIQESAGTTDETGGTELHK